MAQAFHAGVDFCVAYPALTHRWHEMSNNVVIVAVPGEAEVMVLESMALTLGLKHQLVVEPDLDGQITAIALEPGPMAKRLCASYPLALKAERDRERSGAHHSSVEAGQRLCDITSPSPTLYGTAGKESVS